MSRSNWHDAEAAGGLQGSGPATNQSGGYCMFGLGICTAFTLPSFVECSRTMAEVNFPFPDHVYMARVNAGYAHTSHPDDKGKAVWWALLCT